MHVKIFSAFSGYDAMLLALKRLARDYEDFSFECVGYSEIDKYACVAHDALHPDIKSYGDVTTIDWSKVPDFDVLTWSSPCQSVSAAGKLGGMTEDSDAASAVIWSIGDVLSVKHPKYVLLENVANIVGKRFISDFNRFQNLVESFGYSCHCKVMNAVDYGTAQNRNRLFMVAVRNDMPAYFFPEPFRLERKLKDYLEKEVDERYYLSEERVAGLLKSTEKESRRGNGFAFVPKDADVDKTANTVCAGVSRKTDNYIVEPMVKRVGCIYDNNAQAGRVYDPEGVAPTLDTCQGGNREPKIICAAVRGRSDGEWHDSEHSQRLEMGSDEKSNSITSVSKDNVIVEQTVLGWSRDCEGRNVTRHPVDVANCVTASKRDNTQNYVKEDMVPVEQSATEDFYASGDPREYKESAPTIRDEREGLNVKEQVLLNGDKDGNASTITTGHHYTGNITNPKGGHKQMGVLEYNGSYVRVRRLTERELFRLMDVDEDDIDTLLNAGIPRSQLSKLAGNSIVVSCLYHIFRKMFVEQGNESSQCFLF